jgi:hypothetical protein
MVPLMLPFYLLVAHLVGDYLLQTRWQAVGKFGWGREALGLRYRHCLGYTAAFVAVLAACQMPFWNTLGFSACLFVLHFATDAQRFSVTPGEWFVWAIGRAHPMSLELRPGPEAWQRKVFGRLEKNPWAPIGLAIDQTLHLAQIALLAAVYLV